ncbi:MAG: hypothetical protein M1828_005458 [Chrysothrix sp. TS-e1954]|nr:MAG: hypothetical protein M1828_005458 [Chrysothrix sp. TS-e1954]
MSASPPPVAPQSSATNLRLRFPATLSQTFDNLLSETNIDAMDDAASDTTHDSMTDSTYDIISRSSPGISDDESGPGHDNESVASFDESGLDETSSFAHVDLPTHPEQDTPPSTIGTEDEEEYGVGNAQVQTPLEGSEHDVSPDDLSSSQEAELPSTTTVRASTRSTPSMDKVEAVHVLADNLGSSIHGFGRHGAESGEHFTVRQTLSANKLPLGKPFRIAYHGDPTKRNMIMEKIAQALTMSNNTQGHDVELEKTPHTRHSVVQISSFGDSSTEPKVTLVPVSGLEIVIDTCDICSSTWQEFLATCSESVGPNSHPQTKFTTCHQRHERHRSTADRPHLAVFYHKPSDKSVEKTDSFTSDMSLLACSEYYASQLNIPVLDISDTMSEWFAGPYRPYNNEAVHMCVNSARNAANSHGRVLARMPIDLKHFMELDAEQLGRNISCITSTHHDNPWSRKRLESKMLSYIRPVSDAWTDVRPIALPWLRSASLVLPLLFIGFFAMYASLTTSFFESTAGPKIDVARIDAMAHASTSSPACEIVNMHMTASNPSLASATGPVKVEKGLSVVDTDKGLNVISNLDASGRSRSNTLALEVFTSSSGDTFLKVPEKLSKSKNMPDFFISAKNAAGEVPVAVTKCNASFWSLQFPTDPKNHLPIHVSIWTKRGPQLRQSFVVERSAPTWLDLERLESTFFARSKELSKVVSKELDLFRRTTTSVALFSSDWLQKSLFQAQNTSMNFMDKSRHHMQHQSTVIMRAVSAGRTSFSKHLSKQAHFAGKAMKAQMSNVNEGLKQSRLEAKLAAASDRLDRRVKRLRHRTDGVREHFATGLERARSRTERLRTKVQKLSVKKTQARAAKDERQRSFEAENFSWQTDEALRAHLKADASKLRKHKQDCRQKSNHCARHRGN